MKPQRPREISLLIHAGSKPIRFRLPGHQPEAIPSLLLPVTHQPVDHQGQGQVVLGELVLATYNMLDRQQLYPTDTEDSLT
jgi:hypothetical protein